MADDVWVLIADDEPSIAEVIAAIVQDRGYATVVARNGREALALARDRRPALVISDLMMPQLGGADLITALRADGGAGVPVILITASGRARAQAAGADAILLKPFDIEELDGLLDRYLGSATGADGESAVADEPRALPDDALDHFSPPSR